jgi:IclR family transcriptional regulator, pca regulon regulatory protein
MSERRLRAAREVAIRKKRDPRQSPLFIGSAEKVFQVLHAFDGPDRQMPLSVIANRAELDRSAAQRVVHTLETLGYLRRVNDTRDYAPTVKLLQFGYNYLRGNELVAKAAPYLLDLSRTVGETVNMHELDGADIVYVARFPGRHLINVQIMVGTRLPAVLTASGTAILSRSPQDLIENIFRRADLKPLTSQSVLDPARWRKRIKAAHERGYAIITNETVLGDISVGACITDERGRAIAGISISVPTARWTAERAESELAKHIQLTAASLSQTLVHR